MARRSRIRTLPKEQREFIEGLLREDTRTLDEMMAQIRARFPGEQVTSRSALGRYSQHVSELAGRMREIEHASKLIVDELGDGVGDRAGALLAQAVTTLATNAALNAHDDEGISIKEIAALARAARNALEARTMSLRERQAIEKAAEQKMVKKQAAELDKLGKSGRITPEALKTIREQVYGLQG